MLKKWFILSSKVALAFCLCSCATHTSQVENVSGTPTTYEDESSPSEIGDVGFESRDIVSLTDKMMRDIMANPFWGVAEEEKKIKERLSNEFHEKLKKELAVKEESIRLKLRGEFDLNLREKIQEHEDDLKKRKVALEVEIQRKMREALK